MKLCKALGQGQGNRASISFRAGVELFFRYVTRNNDEVPVSAKKQKKKAAFGCCARLLVVVVVCA